jgi:hypothetical protein
MDRHISWAAVKQEHDLPMPFSRNKRPRLVKAGKRGQKARRLLARSRPLQRTRAGISSAASYRSFRPKANVLVEVDCSRSTALQRVLYLESKRQVFAKWSGSNQWSVNCVDLLCNASFFSTLLVRYMYFGVANPEMARLITASQNHGRGIAFDMHAIRSICGNRYRQLQESDPLLRSGEVYKRL